METKALLFIPDVSGFTTFITETEIQHSNHIISELMEAILSSNQLDLKISEIEGDAVLFYRMGEPPRIEEIISQAKKMFFNFHSYLKVIQRDAVCRCGACRTALNLTLKFITHYGEVREVAIQRFHKLFGSDVILAHSLLKNTIPNKEYILLTEGYLATQQSRFQEDESWTTLRSNVENLDSFGEITTKYISLTPLRKSVPDPPKLEENKTIGEGHDLPININVPILFVHQVLIDQKSRLNWVVGIKDVRNMGAIPRINSSHTCVFEDLEIHVVMKENSVRGNEINFIERSEASIGLNFITDYKLKEVNGSTELSLRIIPETNDENMQKMATGVVESMRKNLEGLKSYCENLSHGRAA